MIRTFLAATLALSVMTSEAAVERIFTSRNLHIDTPTIADQITAITAQMTRGGGTVYGGALEKTNGASPSSLDEGDFVNGFAPLVFFKSNSTTEIVSALCSVYKKGDSAPAVLDTARTVYPRASNLFQVVEGTNYGAAIDAQYDFTNLTGTPSLPNLATNIGYTQIDFTNEEATNQPGARVNKGVESIMWVNVIDQTQFNPDPAHAGAQVAIYLGWVRYGVTNSQPDPETIEAWGVSRIDQYTAEDMGVTQAVDLPVYGVPEFGQKSVFPDHVITVNALVCPGRLMHAGYFFSQKLDGTVTTQDALEKIRQEFKNKIKDQTLITFSSQKKSENKPQDQGKGKAPINPFINPPITFFSQGDVKEKRQEMRREEMDEKAVPADERQEPKSQLIPLSHASPAPQGKIISIQPQADQGDEIYKNPSPVQSASKALVEKPQPGQVIVNLNPIHTLRKKRLLDSQPTSPAQSVKGESQQAIAQALGQQIAQDFVANVKPDEVQGQQSQEEIKQPAQNSSPMQSQRKPSNENVDVKPIDASDEELEPGQVIVNLKPPVNVRKKSLLDSVKTSPAKSVHAPAQQVIAPSLDQALGQEIQEETVQNIVAHDKNQADTVQGDKIQETAKEQSQNPSPAEKSLDEAASRDREEPKMAPKKPKQLLEKVRKQKQKMESKKTEKNQKKKILSSEEHEDRSSSEEN